MAHGNQVILTGYLRVLREEAIELGDGSEVRVLLAEVACGPGMAHAEVILSGRVWTKVRAYAEAMQRAGGNPGDPAVTVQGKAVKFGDGRGNLIQVDSIFFHVPPQVQRFADEHFPEGPGGSGAVRRDGRAGQGR